MFRQIRLAYLKWKLWRACRAMHGPFDRAASLRIDRAIIRLEDALSEGGV